jgi:MoxR-like ATPase
MGATGVHLKPGTKGDPAERVDRLIDNIEQVIFGKREAIKLCVSGLLARGHVLIEDIPGIGKTTLAHSLARSIDCSFNRIQFTSDMLPADILGVSILNRNNAQFEFRPGPIFANIVLADEVNRTPPKSQSALLEAMSEFQVSVEGKPKALPQPFMVLATQNPIEYEGTYTLPESQLDRFLIRVELGYPDQASEMRIMRRRDPASALQHLEPVLTADDVTELQAMAGHIHVEESVVRYMLNIITATREDEALQLGASPRASVAFYVACQARALVEGRDYATPGDVKAMAVPVLSHRIILKSRSADLVTSARQRARAVTDVLERVVVPV